ncbi:MAG: tetratricopeptide repeat protein, partial [Prevotella sp.]|nr:tetratricopeptide repeat protein [Prevotella sp.]
MPVNEEYFNSEDFQELLNSYEASMNDGTQPFMDADSLVDIADYYNMHGNADKALNVIEYALELYPYATLPNVFMARHALMQGDFQQAHEYASHIEERDDPDYHYLQAEILIAEGHIDEADRYLRDYGMTVAIDEYEDFIKDCANLYVDYSISDKAYEWMMRSKGDDSTDFKELMARTLFGLEKYKDSERIFNELLDTDPYSAKYWKALAGVQLMAEDYGNALTSSEYAIAIDPDDSEGILCKANALLQLNNYEEAEKYFRRYTESEPDNESGLFHQGLCLIYMGKHKEALQVLQQAEQVSASD